MKRKLGVDHPHTLISQSNLARAYRDAGRTADALRLFEQTFKQRREKLGDDHSDTLVSMAYLGAYAESGRDKEAVPLLETALAKIRQSPGGLPVSRAWVAEALARVRLRQKASDAELLLRECLKLREAKQPDTWNVFNTRSLLGEALFSLKKYEEAEMLLVQGYQGMKERQAKMPPQSRFRLREALERLVKLYDATDKKEQAANWRKELEQARKDVPKK